MAERHARFIFIAILWLTSCRLLAHGGVALTDDICVLSLGNLSAHFASCQPETQNSKEFCEDIPDASNSLFVIDFIHDILATMRVDFRIIRDVNNVGLSANWEDIVVIDDLKAATVYYQQPTLYTNGSMKLQYSFTKKGSYIGIIIATNPANSKVYTAVFPFRVGNKGFWDYLPYFLLLLAFLELFYWVSNGGIKTLNDKTTTN